MSEKSPWASGPAFPVANIGITQFIGITIRDYFAAKALAGMLSDPNAAGSIAELAECSYRYADAMLAEREKKEAV